MNYKFLPAIVLIYNIKKYGTNIQKSSPKEPSLRMMTQSLFQEYNNIIQVPMLGNKYDSGGGAYFFDILQP